MSVKSQTLSPLSAESPPREEVLSLALMLSPADQEWLTEQLARLDPWEDDDDDELPESATFEEAIELFLADKCSLGRAAELAGVTRWHIQDVLKERGIPIVIHTDMTAEEMDLVAEELAANDAKIKNCTCETKMLTAYIRAAMRYAQYKILEDNTFYGEIAALAGVYANAETLEGCREELQEVLEGWILLGLRLGHFLPPVDGIQLDIVKEVA